MKKFALSICIAALIVASAGATAEAELTPTEKIAACVEDAWAKNSACQTDDSHWNDLLCAVKFEADAILCVEVLV